MGPASVTCKKGHEGPVGVGADAGGGGALGGGTVSELSVGVLSPAPEGAVGLNAATVIYAGGDVDPPIQRVVDFKVGNWAATIVRRRRPRERYGRCGFGAH